MTKGNIRLFQPAVMTGFRRGQRAQECHTSLLKIKNVQTKTDTDFYLGKRVAYVFKGKNKVSQVRSAQNPKLKSRVRVMWGRVTRAHGNSGAVRAKFAKNLPGQAMGKKVRVYLYPSRI
ncbi:60S ribosomal protein L35a [Diplonema papillatum]|nr:60S ribosomal protein L35a [Diplonema papillatum]